MPTRNIVPRAAGEGGLGTAAKPWGQVHSNEVLKDGVSVAKESDIKSLYESNADTNAFTDAEKSKLANLLAAHISDLGVAIAANSAVSTNTAKRTYPQADEDKVANVPANTVSELAEKADIGHPHIANDISDFQEEVDANQTLSTAVAKLAGIEAGATADQTASEIETLLDVYYGNTDWRTGGGGTEETAGSIKTKYESNADTNAFTDAEKSKLANLESSKFLGTYLNLASLESTHPDPVPGSYAHVDAGPGSEVEVYVWDDDGAEYVKLAGSGTEETAGSIKTKYESNADTNAFTDAEKSKLANLLAEYISDFQEEVDANQTLGNATAKLAGIEAGATADQTGAEILAAVESESGRDLSDDGDKLDGIEAGAKDDQTAAEIEVLLDAYYGNTDWRTGGGGSGDYSTETTGVAGASVTAGRAVMLGSNGKWTHADKAAEASISGQLAITTSTAALDASINLTLTGGVVSGTFTPGSPYFVGTAGALTATLPSTPGEFVRVVGYGNASGNGLVVLPDPTYIEVPDGSVPAHASSHTDGTDDIQDATNTQKGLATAAQITKLDGIEAGAKDDQTASEIETLLDVYYGNTDWRTGGGGTEETAGSIKTKYESNADTNAFTDAEKSKLANLLAAHISDFQEEVDANQTLGNATAKLAGIEAGATADQTGAEIEALLDAYFGNSDWRTGGDLSEGIGVNGLQAISGAAVSASTDSQKLLYSYGVGFDSYTIQNNATVPMPTGTVLMVMCNSLALSVIAGSGVTINSTTAGTWTSLSSGQIAILIKVATDTWSGYIGGEENNLTDGEASELVGGGNTTLHYHSADRARSNHTGTQSKSTISDFSHASSHTDGTDDIQDATNTQKGLATAAQITKLDGIEAGATADQTPAEILAAVESESGRDMSVDGSKLDGIEAGAKDDQTDAEILAAVESESGRDMSADGSKLDGIEAGATADQTGAEIEALLDAELGSTDWKTGGVGDGDLSQADIDTLPELAAIVSGNPWLVSTINAGEAITAGEIVYLNGTSWALADASAEATAKGLLGIALESGTTGNPIVVGLRIVYSTSGLTAGSAYTLSTTPGSKETEANAPTGTGTIVRNIGWAISVNLLLFAPDETYAENGQSGGQWYSYFLGDNDFEPTAAETRVQWTAPAAGKIYAANAAAHSTATGANLQMDVEKNGTSIFSTGLEIDSGTAVADGNHALDSDPTSFAAGDVFDFDIDQAVTSGAAGVHIDLKIAWD
jgi:hypothetical protein